MKRETGENPVRTRHRVLQAEATDPLGEPGKGAECVRAISRGDLPFAVQERKSSGHEELAVRNGSQNCMWYNTVLFSLSSFSDGGFFWLYIRKELTEAEFFCISCIDNGKSGGKRNEKETGSCNYYQQLCV